MIELTHNWDQTEPYQTGSSWGHIAIGVEDIYGLCERLGKQGVTISRAPGPMQHGTTVIAFIEDPDGRPQVASLAFRQVKQKRPVGAPHSLHRNSPVR